MRTRSTTVSIFLAVMAMALLGTSCSSGPAPPQPGTPAFHWAAAREMYRQGDYLKTLENLGQITRSDNQYTLRARTWQMMVAAGIADGLIEMANVYDSGARRNRSNPTPFRREASALRGTASSAALELAEAMHAYAPANKDKPAVFDFEFPAGSSASPANLQKVSNGMILPAAEADALRRAMIQRGVLLTISRASGAPDDTAKALEIFKAGNVQVPANVFFMAMAGELYDIAQLYGSDKLDQPNRLTALCTVAKEVVAALPPNKQSKDLSSKIEKALKKAKST